MLRIEPLLARHDRPQDSSILVGHGHAGPLPAYPDAELHQPARDRIVAPVRANDSRLGALYQQCAQVVVSSLGDSTQARRAAAGVLAGHDPQPGPN